MFFTVKKRMIVISVALALTIVGIIAAISAPSTPVLGRGKTVVIDAGHGGEDGALSRLYLDPPPPRLVEAKP